MVVDRQHMVCCGGHTTEQFRSVGLDALSSNLLLGAKNSSSQVRRRSASLSARENGLVRPAPRTFRDTKVYSRKGISENVTKRATEFAAFESQSPKKLQ